MVDNALNEILLQRVEQALDSIRPYLKTDGGDVKVLEITEDFVVNLELVGACGTCPMSAMTFKGGIEQAIMRAVPEIKGVSAVNLTPMDV
jgi:Fe-S cluster biogenesis protein NfuA